MMLGLNAWCRSFSNCVLIPRRVSNLCRQFSSGLYLDAQAAFDFLLSRTDIDQTKIVIFGRSLGGAVAIHLASEPYYAKKALCLIVENTFTTLPHIARHLFNSFKIVTYLPIWCYKNKVRRDEIFLYFALSMHTVLLYTSQKLL